MTLLCTIFLYWLSPVGKCGSPFCSYRNLYVELLFGQPILSAHWVRHGADILIGDTTAVCSRSFWEDRQLSWRTGGACPWQMSPGWEHRSQLDSWPLDPPDSWRLGRLPSQWWLCIHNRQEQDNPRGQSPCGEGEWGDLNRNASSDLDVRRKVSWDHFLCHNKHQNIQQQHSLSTLDLICILLCANCRLWLSVA